MDQLNEPKSNRDKSCRASVNQGLAGAPGVNCRKRSGHCHLEPSVSEPDFVRIQQGALSVV